MNELLQALQRAFQQGQPTWMQNGGMALSAPAREGGVRLGFPTSQVDPAPGPATGGAQSPAEAAAGGKPLAEQIASAPDDQPVPSARGIFARMLGIPKDADQNTADTMRRSGLMSMATALLRGGARQPFQRGTFANVADALDAGPQGAMTGLENLDTLIGRDRANQAREIMQGLNGDTSPQGLRNMFLQLLRSGNTDQAKLMAEVIKISDARRANLHYTMGSLTPGGPKQELAFDPTTPGARPTPTGIFGAEPTDRPQSKVLMHNGQPELAYLDPQDPTAAPQWTGQHPPATAMNQAQMRVDGAAEDVKEAMDAMGDNPEAPSAMDAALTALGRGQFEGARGWLSQNAQQLAIARYKFGQAAMLRSGARGLTEAQVTAAGNQYVPQAGDSEQTLRIKQALRHDLLRFMRSSGGRATAILNSLPQFGPMGMTSQEPQYP